MLSAIESQTPKFSTMGLFDIFRFPKIGVERISTSMQRDALDLIQQGNTLEGEGHIEQALRCYEAAIERMPNLARAHLNRGNALVMAGNSTGALAAYETALMHDPAYAAAHYNSGNVLVKLGQREAALSTYDTALKLKPDFVDAEVALGCVQDDLGQIEAAAASYRRALVLQPEYAQVHNNLGIVLSKLGQFEAATASYRRALDLEPNYAEGHNNLGNAFMDLGLLSDAEACYRKAVKITPTYLEAQSNLIFVLNYSDKQNGTLLLSEARRYGELAAQRVSRPIGARRDRQPDRCLRVGFVSGDFRAHPVSYFFRAVLAALVSRCEGRMEFVGYHNHLTSDELTERIKTLCHGWRATIGFSNEALARRIHDDKIDILIDLAGHTAHNRLPVFAWRPAPIQVSWLGYFGTTGVAEIDYLIADPWTLPPREESSFTERIWRLPETRLCFSAPDVNLHVNELPALAEGYVTFGCFNNLTKMNNEVVALWARVLTAVPNSRLFLKSPQLGEAPVRQGVVGRFAAHGIDSTRLTMEGLSSRFEYLKTYQRIDIALDPFPYTGGTTTCEALWMGVPVLTLAGERFLSRQGVGLLMNARLPQWVASDADDYLARALTHASDLPSLARLRAGLRQQALTSPLFDAPRFTDHFEQTLRSMWRLWCEHGERHRASEPA
jgi:predicted O-linked N-acetylglucosamine transferase (SPINDLY family)